MTRKPLPSQAELAKLLSYDPETGKLFWKPQPGEYFATKRAAGIWNSRFAGREAFTGIDPVTGYHRAGIKGVRYRAHRIIWKLVYGVDPDVIDHLNHGRTDNRLDNLRSGTLAENNMNSLRVYNTGGVPGVRYREDSGLWIAHIRTEGRQTYLGQFNNHDDAAAARKNAEQALRISQKSRAHCAG